VAHLKLFHLGLCGDRAAGVSVASAVRAPKMPGGKRSFATSSRIRSTTNRSPSASDPPWTGSVDEARYWRPGLPEAAVLFRDYRRTVAARRAAPGPDQCPWARRAQTTGPGVDGLPRRTNGYCCRPSNPAGCITKDYTPDGVMRVIAEGCGIASGGHTRAPAPRSGCAKYFLLG
jgi:hypothetical protein